MAEKLCDGVYRIKIPFEDIYTSSFILTESGKSFILDCGNDDNDAKRYIIPTVNEMGIVPEYVICSHSHKDHSGGLGALVKEYPDARLRVNDSELIFGRFRIIRLKGHSDDSIAVLDIKNKLLLSCDCLQAYGISSYGTHFDDYNAYMTSIEKARALGAEKIIASHEYVSIGSIADTEVYLNECEEAVRKLKDFISKNNKLSDKEIAKLYNKAYMELPTIGSVVIREIRKAERF